MMVKPIFDFSEFPIIETPRLILREPVLSDSAELFIFRSDPIVQRYNDELMTDISQAREFIQVHRTEYYNNERTRSCDRSGRF